MNFVDRSQRVNHYARPPIVRFYPTGDNLCLITLLL